MNAKKNYLYTLIYQVITIAFPLITIPYISRVLGSSGVGTYSFTNSIVQYFVLFGMLGIGTYGVKQIAEARDDKKRLSETFFSIYTLQLIMIVIALFIYMLFLQSGTYNHKNIMYIQSIALLACLVDCSWFFSGLEKFKQIVIRNIAVKLVGLLLIFTLVKTSDDLALYTFIMTISTLIGQLILWFEMRLYIQFVAITRKQIKEHFKPTLAYFIPQVAAQVFFIVNKTMLGILSTESEVGIYDYSDKILKVCLAFITSLGTVMLPKMAYMFSKGEIEKSKEYILNSLDFSNLFAIPMMLGLAGVSVELIPWYLGEEFSKSVYVLIIISPTILFMSWSGVFGNQYLLPLGEMGRYTISIYVGATVNIVFNLLLIKPFGSIGSAIATLLAELSVLVVQLMFMRKVLEFRRIILKTFDYFVAGLLMFMVVRMIGHYLGVAYYTTLLQGLLGVITYLLIVLFIEYWKKEGLVLTEVKKWLYRFRLKFGGDSDFK